MTEEELIKFLSNNLKLEIDYDPGYNGSYSQIRSPACAQIILSLKDKKISTVEFPIPVLPHD
jgi:hypothetical protein